MANVLNIEDDVEAVDPDGYGGTLFLENPICVLSNGPLTQIR